MSRHAGCEEEKVEAEAKHRGSLARDRVALLRAEGVAVKGQVETQEQV